VRRTIIASVFRRIGTLPLRICRCPLSVTNRSQCVSAGVRHVSGGDRKGFGRRQGKGRTTKELRAAPVNTMARVQCATFAEVHCGFIRLNGKGGPK
jgi:hypothetical protein